MSDEIAERLEKLHNAFVAALPEKLNSIDRLWQTVKQQDVASSSNVDELYRTVHSLAGAAGSFGQQQVGDSARRLEQIFQQHLNTAKPISFATMVIIETELNRLKNSIR